MNLEELATIIKARRSVRRWQERDVPPDLLLRAVELATWAPNGGNRQNWHFYIVFDRGMIRDMAEAVNKTIDRMASWPEFGQVVADTERWRRDSVFFRKAPAAIIVTVDKYQSTADRLLEIHQEDDPEAKSMREWRGIAASRIQSAGAAIGYLLLALHQMGLGACWMTGPVQAKAAIERMLGVAPGRDFITFIPVGYPAESPEPRPRLPIEAISTIVPARAPATGQF